MTDSQFLNKMLVMDHRLIKTEEKDKYLLWINAVVEIPLILLILSVLLGG